MPRKKPPVHSIHRGLDYDRVEADLANGRWRSLEVAFADEWEGTNKPQPGLNSGHGTLQDLMMIWPRGQFTSPYARLVLTGRDCAVAATAIQWLGTNIGSEWLRATVKRAGWMLLHPSEAEHYEALEENLRVDRERNAADVRTRELEVVQREVAMEAREKALRVAQAEVDRRQRMLDGYTVEMEQKRGNWLALMMTANLKLFRRSEPSPAAKPRRKIALHAED